MNEEDFLLISGIQHFYFCKRQWFLIHVEQQWDDNILTVKGNILHEKVDDPYILESRKNYFISRSMPLVSYDLGFFGISDAVEFILDSEGIYIASKKNYYKIAPIEYKAGKPKKDDCDNVQLCLQAMCLEEMLNIEIPFGYFYYAKTRHREKIEFNHSLREKVKDVTKIMHQAHKDDKIFLPVNDKRCIRCSMRNICLPQTQNTYKSVKKYIQVSIREKEEENA